MSKTSKGLTALAGGLGLHAGLLALAPLWPLGAALLALLWWPLCHQSPERSLLWGQHWPLCARCLGLSWGLGGGALAALGLRYVPSRGWPLLALALLGLDVASRSSGGVELGNPAHWLVGLLAGLALASQLPRLHQGPGGRS